MKDLKIRLFWIIWVDPESNDKVFMRHPEKGQREDRSHEKMEAEIKGMQGAVTWMKRQRKVLI